MQDRDERILKHIGLYRVSLRGVIEELFFDGKSCDHVIQRLLNEGRIQAVEGLPDKLSYYQLTLRETRSRGIPKHRADSRGGRLPEDLAVLWFACMGARPRPRVERKPLGKVFGRGPGMGVPHCREHLAENEQVIYRVRFAGPDTDDTRLLRDIEWWARSGLAHHQLGPYLLEQLYGFVILVEHPDRVERLQELLARREALTGIRIHVESVPGPMRIAAALRARKAKRDLKNGGQK
jgi:hypothetical protein